MYKVFQLRIYINNLLFGHPKSKLRRCVNKRTRHCLVIFVFLLAYLLGADVLVYLLGADVLVYLLGAYVLVYLLGADVLVYLFNRCLICTCLLMLGADVLVYLLGAYVLVYLLGADVLVYLLGADVLVYRTREGELVELDATDNSTNIIMDNSTFVSEADHFC